MQTYLVSGLADRLKAKKHLTSDQDLARIIGCSEPELDRLDRQEQCLSTTQIVAISIRFGVPFSEITSGRKTGEHNQAVHDTGRSRH